MISLAFIISPYQNLPELPLPILIYNLRIDIFASILSILRLQISIKFVKPCKRHTSHNNIIHHLLPKVNRSQVAACYSKASQRL